MGKLTTYELANLAMWSFDFERANDLYKQVIEEFSERTDLIGTEGAVEGAILSREARLRDWDEPMRNVSAEQVSSFIKTPLVVRQEERDRVRRLESVISAREKEIIRNLEKQKARLRADQRIGVDKELGVSGRPTKTLYGDWFIAVQRLVSFCVGRAYRRDGVIPGLESVREMLKSAAFAVKHSDERCLIVQKDNLMVELWFDGRVCCVSSPEHFDEIFPSLELIANVCNAAILQNYG